MSFQKKFITNFSLSLANYENYHGKKKINCVLVLRYAFYSDVCNNVPIIVNTSMAP